jgi:hypothetical protein
MAKHKQDFVRVRGGLIVACSGCGWTGTYRYLRRGVPYESQRFPSLGDARYAYDVHKAEALDRPIPSRTDAKGFPLQKYRV